MDTRAESLPFGAGIRKELVASNNHKTGHGSISTKEEPELALRVWTGFPEEVTFDLNLKASVGVRVREGCSVHSRGTLHG